MVLIAGAIVYLTVTGIFVPTGKWDWTSLVVFVPITLVLAFTRAPVSWFIGIELCLSILFFNVRELFGSGSGLGDALEGSHVLLGVLWGARLVAIQLPVYWLVKFLARDRTA